MKKVKFWILIATYLLLAFADGALTYINTPDLSAEGNPLVAQLGLGWGALATANIVIFILFFTAAYYSFFKYQTKYTNETKFTAYCSQITFGRPDKFWTGLIPKHITPYIAGMGFAFFPAGIIARLVLVLEWIVVTVYTFDYPRFRNLYYSYVRYCSFKRTYCGGRLDIVLAAVAIIVGIFYWLYTEFKKQLKKNAVTAE